MLPTCKIVCKQKNMNFPRIILFLPKKAHKNDFCYIEGHVKKGDDNVVIFYGLSCTENLKKKKNNCIATCGVSSKRTSFANFVAVGKSTKGCYEALKIILENNNVTEKYHAEILLFFYDEKSFNNKYLTTEHCYFSKLQHFLLLNCNSNQNQWKSTKILSKMVDRLSDWGSKAEVITKYSSIAMHLKCVTERTKWLLENQNYEIENQSINQSTRRRIKSFNLLVCFLLDYLLGYVTLYLLMTITTTESFPDLFLFTAENCVETLRTWLHWLTESPAGFKLNKELNNMLTKFYLFHTEIWWLFLVTISPCLSFAFMLFTLLGQLGLTFQAAILSDIFSLVSFHAYCIYAYAAKLYNIQVSGIRSLGRLFLGRKWNPLREKVDSCQYSADQLFVGTLVFTILLFLLPTTLIYYIVFTWVRLMMVALAGLLSRVRLYLHALPIYSLLLWIFADPSMLTQITIATNEEASSPSVSVLHVEKVRGSVQQALKADIPDCIDKAPSILSVGIFKKLLTGEIIYPV